MATKASVTRWIGELQDGDHDAAAQLWEHYFRRLVGLARKKLRNAPRQAAADEEDVALSAFDSFCRGAQRGQFRQLENRGNLWRLLVTLTARKAFDQVRGENAQKRGGGTVRTESAIGAGDATLDGIGQIACREPTPEFAAQLVEECSRLLLLLNEVDPDLRSVALWKLEGHTSEEIAAKLSCAPSTVERKLRRIRGIWAEERPA